MRAHGQSQPDTSFETTALLRGELQSVTFGYRTDLWGNFAFVIAARVAGLERYYLVTADDDGTLTLLKRLNGVDQVLAQGPTTWKEDEVAELWISVDGTRISGVCLPRLPSVQRSAFDKATCSPDCQRRWTGFMAVVLCGIL